MSPSEIIRFIEKPGVQDRGGRHVAKCRSLWPPGNRARGASIRGQFILSRNLGYKTRGHHVAKRSSETHVAYPEVKVHVRDLVRVVGSVASFAQGRVDTQGKFVLSSPRG